jgi:hypothetical protein
MRSTRTSSAPLTRFAIALPAAQALGLSFNDRDLALSPDGTRFVYTAGAQAQLMVRRSINWTPSRGRHRPTPARRFVSPTGAGSRFLTRLTKADNRLCGPPRYVEESADDGWPAHRALADYWNIARASWGPDDAIVFATNDTSTGLLRVPAGGGEPTVLTKADPAKDEEDHYFPSVLPGARGVLFTTVGKGHNRGRTGRCPFWI